LGYVRPIQLKEFLYNDDDVDDDFSDIPAFRKKFTWCPDKNRDLFLESYASALEKKQRSYQEVEKSNKRRRASS